MKTQCDRSEAAAAYVLGEMGSAELDDFARHLRTCTVCADEVELLESAADAIPLLATRPPTREAPLIGAKVAGTLSLQSGAKPTPTLDELATSYQQRRRPRLRVIAGGIASGAVGSASGAIRGGRARNFLQRPVPKPVLFMFGALAVAAIITTVLLRESGSISYVKARIAWSPGDAIVAIEGSRADLHVVRMPQPPKGRVYEIWVLDKGTTALAPTGAYVDPNRRGGASVDIPGDAGNLVAIAVFEEPTNGPQISEKATVLIADLIPGTITNPT